MMEAVIIEVFERAPFAVLATLALGLASLAKGAVSPSGALGGLVVGITLGITVGWQGWLVLMVFFLSSSLLGLLSKKQQEDLKTRHERGGRRSGIQVLANVSPQVVAGIIGFVASIQGDETLAKQVLVVFLIGFSCATADTWASEIGILSKKPPRSIWGFFRLEAGQSGGMSLLGTMGALGGAVLVGSMGIFFDFPLQILIFVASMGFLGSLVDSALGGSLQALYQDSHGTWTEKPLDTWGKPHRIIRGWRFVTNDVVNWLSICIVMVLGWFMGPWLM